MEELIALELQKLLSGGVTEEEIDRAKNSMIASAIYAQDSQSGLARLFGSALTTGLTIEDVQTWPSQVRAVTIDDVLDVARTYLKGMPVVGELRIETPTEPAAALSDDQQLKDKS